MPLPFVAAGALASFAAGAVLVKYNQNQYNAKITELEGYYTRLSTYLDRMVELKEQIFDFWQDEDGRKAAIALQLQIESTQTTMDQLMGSINSYKTIVAELDVTKTQVSGDVDAAIQALGGK